MMTYFAPKPAPRGFRFGPGYGERQPGWPGQSYDPMITNPVRPQPPGQPHGWPPEVSLQTYHGGLARDWAQERLGSGWPTGYDRGYRGLPAMDRFGGAWGFAPNEQAWAGQGIGWTGFDRLAR